MNYEYYVELPGEDHGTIIAKSMPTIFAFFAEHTGPIAAADRSHLYCTRECTMLDRCVFDEHMRRF